MRVGSSDFVIFIQNVLNEGHATLAAVKLLGGLEEPFTVGNKMLKVGTNIGIALFPDHGQDELTLLRSAEAALLESRRNLPPYSVSSSKYDSAEATTWDITSELQKAIDLDQMEMYFQPQVYLETGRVFGAEALIRWKHPNRGYIRPDYFIPIAEQSDLIYDITNWTINAVLWLMKEWPEMSQPLNVAINLSPKMFEYQGLVETITEAANLFGGNASQLTLEITESALMRDISTSIQCLQDLKDEGVKISIDDFGTGHSSMSHFKNIPAHELKIDHSFVTNLFENAIDRHIVDSVTKMAQGFGLVVVAEGVEDQQTYDELKAIGCDVVQGYFVGKPMPQEKFIEWLQLHNNYSKILEG
jgi:EAL domain-containing protein (putative c-di-GMP-specific phosphodiesterase class I)